MNIDLVTQDADGALELWEARRRTDLLEKLLGREVALRVSKKRSPSQKRGDADDGVP